MNVNIRQAEFKDLAFIVDEFLKGVANNHFHSPFPSLNYLHQEQECRKYFKKIIQYQLRTTSLNGQNIEIYTCLYVYEYNNNLAGFLSTGACEPNKRADQELYLIKTNEKYQNRGIASYVLDRLLKPFIDNKRALFSARCHDASKKMKQMLIKRNFKLVSNEKEVDIYMLNAPEFMTLTK